MTEENEQLKVIPSGARPTSSCSEGVPLSKKALKRLKRRKEYLESRKERKKIKKDRIKSGDLAPPKNTRKLVKKTGKSVEESECKVGIILDMSWERLMNQKEVGKVLKQTGLVYCLNRRLSNPMGLHITSFHGVIEEEMKKNQGYQNWDAKFYDKHFSEVFDKSRLVYLSSESPNVLETLRDDALYIIGGLVDHNNHKGICYEKAKELGIPTARLPIDEFVLMKTRKVLTINQVYHIVALVSEGKTWKESFMQVIPEKKGATPINEETPELTSLKDNEVTTT